MRHHPLAAVASASVLMILCGHAAASHYVSVSGYSQTQIETQVTTNPFDTGQVGAGPVTLGNSTVDTGTNPAFPSHAEATSTGTASYYSLSSSITCLSNASPGANAVAHANAQTAWLDVVTFHTPDPNGSDFVATLAYSASWVNTAALWGANSQVGMTQSLFVNFPTGPMGEFLTLFSSPIEDPGAPVSAIIHAHDGDVYAFGGHLSMDANCQNGEPGTISGQGLATFSITSGAPGASTTTESGSTIPAPSGVLAFAAAALAGKRRRRS